MPQHFIDANGNYFVSLTDIEAPDGSTEVTPRPSHLYIWQNDDWVIDVQAQDSFLQQQRGGMSLSFAQLLIGLVTEAWITEAEGEAWLGGTLPAPVLSLIATLPAGQQFAAKARALRPSVVMRVDPLVASLGAAQGKTDAELDAFFTTYAQV